MEEPIVMPRIVNSAETEWGDHPRFTGIQMKALLTKADNALANISMVRVPSGGQVGWHMHATQVETVYLLSGHAVLTIRETESELTAGCIVAIPAGAKHSLRNVGSETVELLAIFTPPIS
jgi:quercetin dioxygenase-like cupin family protein